MNLREAVSTFRGHRVPHLNLIGRRKRWFVLSGVIIALSVVGLVVRGVNLSIDFEGGALLTFSNRTGISADDVRETMGRFGRTDAEVQIIGGTEVSVRTRSLSGLGDERIELLDALARQAGVTTDDISTQDVGPTFGSQISRKALQGLIIFLAAVSVYIAVRFEWKMAAAAQAALLHDLVITAGVYALVGREVTPATLIALLTILGYSLYDTVVIFDKVKENTESPALVARETYSGVVNSSLNQTLMRSVNTSLTTLLPITSLLLFGGDTLKDFAFALAVGVASGTYSSIFVASPILAVLKEREPRYAQMRTRAVARAAARAPLRAVLAPSEARGADREPVAVATPVRPGGHRSARPKRKGRPQGRRRRR